MITSKHYPNKLDSLGIAPASTDWYTITLPAGTPSGQQGAFLLQITNAAHTAVGSFAQIKVDPVTAPTGTDKGIPIFAGEYSEEIIPKRIFVKLSSATDLIDLTIAY